METRLVVLLVEDDPDSVSDYKEDIEGTIDVIVIAVAPPADLADLATAVNQHNASAVILDELLQQRSDATYLGIDALEYLGSAFPGLPLDILTNYPHGPELRGRKLYVDNLIRKWDFDDNEAFRRAYLQKLYERMKQYRERENEHRQLATTADAVTEEFVASLARLHFDTDSGVEKIIWVRSCGVKQICLIEVNRTALPADRVEAFRFAPSKDVPFPLFITDVRPTEWERIQNGEMALPEGWTLENALTFLRPDIS